MESLPEQDKTVSVRQVLEAEPCTSKDYLEEDTLKTEASTSALKPAAKSTSRKRKYHFNTDSTVPKKIGKFYFTNDQTTKPRKPKITNFKTVQTEKRGNVAGKRHKMHFTKVDSNGNMYLVHRLHSKSDLFFNDEKKYSYEPFKKLDLAFHVVDEIALEGLDGITLEAFWKRLRNVFPNNISKSVADKIWRVICNNKRINFYVLKEQREELVFFDRCKYLDIDSGMFVEPFIEFKDIYPLSSINGTEIRGSCSTFNTRKENNGVRKFSVEKVIKLYNQKLVFVADQALRNKALINEEADPNIELQDVEYCMLEKIGRSRDQGEFTQGRMSLVHDSKKVYHNRKVLSQHSLIAHQSFCLKSLAMRQNISGGLIHLSRFYHKRKTKQIAIMERISQILKSKPNYQIEFNEFRKIFGRNVSLVKLVKTADFRKFFKLCTYPYRKLYPNATKQEYLSKNKFKEREIKVLRMIDPYANVTALMDAKDSKEVPQEKFDSSPGNKLINYEYLREIFLYILSSKHIGVTIQEIHDYFKTDFYSVRMAVKKLLLRNIISSIKVDLGRQQSLKFFAKCHAGVDCLIQTQPRVHKLTDETLSRVLKSYDQQDDNECPTKLETLPTPLIPTQTQFKLSFQPFCCTSFLTETVDANSEDLTIYDIVSKGRDKLLLIESNLFAQYMSEWDDFFLKREDFFKSIQLFHNGFGKVIYNFLMTVRLSENIEHDNQIVFAMKNIRRDARIRCRFSCHRIVNIPRHFTSPHSDTYHVDIISKIYILEAMLDEFHTPSRCIEKIKSVFDRFMISSGKKKRNSDESVGSGPKIEVEVSNNVVMEKYMGDNPTVEWNGEDAEITIEVVASTKPEVTQAHGAMFSTDDVNVTQRYMNRANLILTTVYEQKIVPDVWTLYKDVLKEEGEEGYDKRACKKSIISIITRLVAEGYIKCYKIVMNGKNMTRTQSFICVHEVGHDHNLIVSSIEQLKLKFYVGSSHAQKTITIKKKNESPFSSTDVKDSITELRQLTSAHVGLDFKLDRAKGKLYGYTPKFVRMRVLHEHLFYVIREIVECDPLTPRQVFDLFKNLKIKLSQSDMAEMPPIYRNEVSWKMFIPCLPINSHRPRGWALACDFVLRMPLSVFVKLYNIPYNMPELETYLQHPIKKHYLLKYLPARIRNVLLHKRKYFHSIYDTICNLCYVGLVQLGPRSIKEKDQLFVYLNSRATLFNTCSSKPGYNLIEDKKYKRMPIEFKTGSDIEIYWSEMLRICMNTQLGRRKILDGQIVTIEDCSAKPAMLETLKAKSFEEAVANDNGMIPGDHRGAAGFDSSLWSFVKRNWVWNATKERIRSGAPYVKNEKVEIALPEPIQYDLVAKGGPPERKVYLKKRSKIVKLTEMKKFSKKKFMRKIIAPKKKKVREYCDAIDLSIMKKNPGIKVSWTDEEDQLLRYCRIACVFLCPVFKKQFIPYNILRDVLHRIHPKSKNKTARAIQRRIYVLLTNDEILKIMETNIENLLNSDTISKYFEQVHNRYKNGNKVSDVHIYISFVYFMAYICKHRKEVELLLLGYFASFDFFSDSNVADFEPLLQNCEDTTNTIIYASPKTVEDITKDTIKSVIHCSMACRTNSSAWTLLLSRIYKQFQDDLVRASVSNLKKHQFFVQNKNAETKSIDNPWPTPIKFSHVYKVMKTSSSYTVDVYKRAYKNFAALIGGRTDAEVLKFIECNELNSLWEKTNFVFDVPEMGIILNPDIEDHSEVIEELAKRFRIYLDQIYQKNNGPQQGSSVPSVDKESPDHVEKNLGEIKSEVGHLIFRVPYLLEGNLDMCFNQMRDSNSILEISKYIFLMIVDLKKFAQTSISLEGLKHFVDGIENDADDDCEKLVTNLSKVVFAIQNIHQSHDQEPQSAFELAFKLWEDEVWDKVRIGNDEDTNSNRKPLFSKNYANGMEHCIEQAQEGNFPSLEEIKEGIMAEVAKSAVRKIPHITDLIMLLNEDRFPELDTDIETIERMKDHFVMQYPKLDQFVIEDLEQMQELDVMRKLMHHSTVEVVKQKTENIVGPCQMDGVIKYIRSQNGCEDDVKVIEDLIDFIRERKEFGASGNELKNIFKHKISLNLVGVLDFLNEINVVLRTGVVSIIYVYHEYQSEWLTKTFFLSTKEKEILESKHKQEIKKKFNVKGEKLQLSDSRNVQLKPWTNLDGSINDDVLHEWMCTILSRCIDFPYIPFMVLCEQFHYIKPVDTYLLLEILEALGCVDIYVLKTEENNLFSQRNLASECKATCLDKFEDMFVRPTNVAGLCFGSFLDKGLL